MAIDPRTPKESQGKGSGYASKDIWGSKIEKMALVRAKKRELEKLRQRAANIEKERAEARKKILDYEKENKILYFGHPEAGYLGRYGKWEPTRPQNLILNEFANSIRTTLLYEGGNRGGKTFLLTILCLACIRGYFPWEPKENAGWLWRVFGWEPPIKIRIVGQDWKKHIADVLVPRFEELLPKSWGFESAKMGEIATSQYYDPVTHGKINIVSNSSESANLEGWEGHFVAYDEPPTRANRIACSRGLTDYNGKEFFSMTLLKEPWIESEIMEAVDEDGNFDTSIFVAHTKMTDNLGHGLNQAGIDSFRNKLTPEEIKIRIDGESAFKSGKILSIDRSKHILELTPENIRPNWLIDIQIDYHPSKPQYILFLATDESNFKYVCHTILGHGDGYWIADQIVKAVKRYSMRVKSIFADPLSTSGKMNLIETEYDKISNGLSRFGYRLQNAGRLKSAKEDGIIRINSLLNTKNKLIALYFFKTCGYAIKQCCGWMWDDKGMPVKKDDDYPECLYRGVLLDTEYFPPEDEDEKEDDRRSSQVKRNTVTGY